jgi:hypothetical protein
MVRRFVAAMLFLSSVAHADALDHLEDGGALYGEVRPAALIGALKRLGVDQLAEVQQLKQQMGGIDLFNPDLLAPSGIDLSAPIAAGVDVSTKSGSTHFRVVATVRDSPLFRTFLGAIVDSKQAPLTKVEPGSPLGQLGVLCTADLPDHAVAIARLEGDALIVDGVDTWNDKPMKPLDIAKRFPTKVAQSFPMGHGARRLFAPDAALLVYADGRRFTDVLEALGRMDLEDDLQREKPAARAKLRLKRTAELKRCTAEWARSSSTFDDVGLSLNTDRNELRLKLGWGTLGGTPLGGLSFSPHDDAAVDTEFLGRQAPMVLSLFAASASPFQSLKRSGIYESADTLDAFTKRCGQEVGLGVFVRSWPQAVGTALGEVQKPQNQQQLGPLASALALFGQLRNLVIILRDVSNLQAPQFALAATFDGQARTLLEGILSLLGATGADKLIGKRTAKVFTISSPAVGNFVAALETLGTGPLLFTFADSEESLKFAYRVPTPMPKAAPAPPATQATPIASFHLDGGVLAKMGLASTPGAKPALDFIARLKRLDAYLAADGDLFQLTAHLPVK